jgi:carbon-monoxide dehydrogenase medium subunit
MYEFNYHRPASLDEAKQILAANAEAKIIAGGMTLLPTMKLRLAQPSDLVDLSAIDGLDAISDAGSAIDIGAMARHADVAHSEVVRSAIPALADLADAIGDAQVRNRGTLGGSIANSDPAAERRTIIFWVCSRPPWPTTSSWSRCLFPSRRRRLTRSSTTRRRGTRSSA